MFHYSALLSLSFAAIVYGQQVGTNTAENHPRLTSQKCTTSGGCTTQDTAVVLDANWRWLHSTSGYTNCYTGNSWDTSLCPDGDACAKNCAIDGADYSGKLWTLAMLHHCISNGTQVPTVSRHPTMP